MVEGDHQTDSERDAVVEILTESISILKPLEPHLLDTEITPDHRLFHMVHMGVAAVCRVENARWTSVLLRALPRLAQPKPCASYIWSGGLDSDIPLEDAMAIDALLERGGPVRLVVPGWHRFALLLRLGTNTNKWICHISLQDRRAPGPFTTIFYNELDPQIPVEPNSIIVCPAPGEIFYSHRAVAIKDACVAPRKEYEWQLFKQNAVFDVAGSYIITARATDRTGLQQPLRNRRNQVSTVGVTVLPARNGQ
ncbi:hypothetical protein BDW71DRAFT_200709 [Aspergillus fruticulosus]